MDVPSKTVEPIVHGVGFCPEPDVEGKVSQGRSEVTCDPKLIGSHSPFNEERLPIQAKVRGQMPMAFTYHRIPRIRVQLTLGILVDEKTPSIASIFVWSILES